MGHTLEYKNIQLHHKFAAYGICVINSSIYSTWSRISTLKSVKSNPPENTRAVLKVLLSFVCWIWSISSCSSFTLLKASRHLWKCWPVTQREQTIKDPNRNLPWVARNTYILEIRKCNYNMYPLPGDDHSGNYIWMDCCIQLVIGLWCRVRLLISYTTKWKKHSSSVLIQF